jgi:hypothetical protein
MQRVEISLDNRLAKFWLKVLRTVVKEELLLLQSEY